MLVHFQDTWLSISNTTRRKETGTYLRAETGSHSTFYTILVTKNTRIGLYSYYHSVVPCHDKSHGHVESNIKKDSEMILYTGF